MLIIIPMAGKSQRFRDAGYETPKFMLPLMGASVFDHAVGSFSRYFKEATFVLIPRDREGEDFALNHAKAAGIKRVISHIVPDPEGMGDTVYKTLSRRPDIDLNQPALIHMVDTFRPEFSLPEHTGTFGFAEFCYKPRSQAERSTCISMPPEPPLGESAEFPLGFSIAFLRGTGLYYLRCAGQFMAAYGRTRQRMATHSWLPEKTSGLAEGLLLIHELKKGGIDIGLRIINRADVIFCGVPAEYEELRRRPGRLKTPRYAPHLQG